MSDKKNVVVIINTLSKGGAEKQAIILANKLSEYHHVTLLVLDISNCDQNKIQSLLPNVEKVFFDGLNYRTLYSIITTKEVKNADIVISMLLRSNLIAGIINLINKRAKIFGGIRNCELKKGKFTVEYILHKYFHSKTIFNNQSGKINLIKKGFLTDKAVTIHNCVEFIPKRKEKRIDRNKKVKIVSLSRFVCQKDLPTAIEAINYLNEKFDNQSFIFLMGGYGEKKKKILAKIDEKKLSDLIKIVEDPDVPNFLSDGDIFLSTSLIEGTSNSILEAMSYSLPVVATDVGDNNCLVDNNVNGYLVAPGDFKTIALYLNKLINNQVQRKEFGAKSYNKIVSYFNEERFTKDYLELINE